MALLVATPSTNATKPCPPSPCFDSTGKANQARCFEAASWVAVGRIIEVQHHPEGSPLNKDFATFVFLIDHWEKGEQRAVQRICFKVGWCDNAQEVPEDTSGFFRFYGTGTPGATADAPKYLYFERVADK
jgi:hypothetical protein